MKRHAKYTHPYRNREHRDHQEEFEGGGVQTNSEAYLQRMLRNKHREEQEVSPNSRGSSQGSERSVPTCLLLTLEVALLRFRDLDSRRAFTESFLEAPEKEKYFPERFGLDWSAISSHQVVRRAKKSQDARLSTAQNCSPEFSKPKHPVCNFLGDQEVIRPETGEEGLQLIHIVLSGSWPRLHRAPWILDHPGTAPRAPN